MVSQYQKVGSCLGGAVRAAGVDRGFFCKEQVRTIQRQISVNFVCRYLMITLDPVFPAGVHKYGSSFDIGVQEYFRIFNGTVYVTFSGKVYHHVRMLFFK